MLLEGGGGRGALVQHEQPVCVPSLKVSEIRAQSLEAECVGGAAPGVRELESGSRNTGNDAFPAVLVSVSNVHLPIAGHSVASIVSPGEMTSGTVVAAGPRSKLPARQQRAKE